MCVIVWALVGNVLGSCLVCLTVILLFCIRQMKSAGSLCRDSVNECDLVEYCTGLSHQCPPDDFHMNGLPCSSQEGYCYNGRCPTHLQHCHSLWGTGEALIIHTLKSQPSTGVHMCEEYTENTPSGQLRRYGCDILTLDIQKNLFIFY